MAIWSEFEESYLTKEYENKTSSEIVSDLNKMGYKRTTTQVRSKASSMFLTTVHEDELPLIIKPLKIKGIYQFTFKERKRISKIVKILKRYDHHVLCEVILKNGNRYKECFLNFDIGRTIEFKLVG